MTLMTRRSPSTLSEVVDWLETIRPSWGEGFIPIEEYREDGRLVVRADIPGVDPDKDITVTVDDGYLSIHGERREEEHDEHHSEVRFGSFSRRLPLPRDCSGDDVTASYSSGVLTVSLPINEQVTEPARIPVARTGD